MIVKMKKLTILAMTSDRDAKLEALRDLGVLHIHDVKPPAGENLDSARADYDYAARILDILPDVKHHVSPPGKDDDALNERARAVMDETMTCSQKKNELSEALKKLSNEAKRVETLGNFNPDALKQLSEKGVDITIYSVNSGKIPVVQGDTVVIELARQKKTVYFAVIGAHEPESGWTLFRVPESSLEEIKARIAEIETELISLDTALLRLAKEKNLVQSLYDDIKLNLDFQRTKAGMGEEVGVVYLQGFCPADSLELIKTEASKRGWGLVVEDPGPDDNVPTLIRHPKWVKPIKAVFDVIGILPGYKEVDISAVFLLFFSIFFAMLIGDAGYGLLFLIATLAAKFKLRDAPSYPFTLMGILSGGTIVWGVLTGNYFGVQAGGPLSKLSIDWLNNDNNLMGLCFLIGAIHLTIAHVWNAIKIINTPQALAQVGWILITWTMMFLARFFVLGERMPPAVIVLGCIGLTLVVLFMTPVRRLKAEIINHAMLGLSVVSNFVDVVSYVRLFAVGMASVMVAQSFNSMALQLGIEKIWTIPFIALILFAGHALNIVLCALGILVHAVRLNTLEFSNHIGLQWAGIKYNPFRKK